MTKAPPAMTAHMASDAQRLRTIRERIGADRFARAAYTALTSSKTIDEALAEVGVDPGSLTAIHPPQRVA